MKNKKIFISFLIILPIGLWLLSMYTDIFKPKPTVTKIEKTSDAPLQYSQARAAHKDELIKRNYQLATNDQQVVNGLIQKNGPLLLTENVIVIYDKKDELFKAEITTVRIEPAKREAITWFKEQGLSNEAICILPVTFTIDEKSAKSLQGLDIIFDPLPTECK